MKAMGGIRKVLIGSAILLTCTGINARADSILSGLTVSAVWDFSTLGSLYESATPSSAVVGPSDANFVFGPFNTAVDIVLSASTNTITLNDENNGNDGSSFIAASFNGFVISVLNPPSGFAFNGVQFQSSNWDNETPQVSFDATNIYVNMQGMKQIGPGSDVVLSYTADPTTVVPDAGTLLLFGAGLVGLCGVARRKLLG